MSGGVDGGDARRDLIARLQERRTVGQWHTNCHEQFAVELACFADIFAALPEIELGCPEYIARIGKHGLAAFDQSADVVRMPMRDDNNVDVFRTVAGNRKPCRSLARRKTLAELLVFARERTIARVKQDQLLAGVHERRNIGMLESLSIDIVGASKSHHLIS